MSKNVHVIESKRTLKREKQKKLSRKQKHKQQTFGNLYSSIS